MAAKPKDGNSDKESPWYGKRCTKCDSPINYAYKSQIEGWCGKCTDQVRAAFHAEWERDGAQRSKEMVYVERRISGASGFMLGTILGILVGLGGAVATQLYLPDTWKQVIQLLGGVG